MKPVTQTPIPYKYFDQVFVIVENLMNKVGYRVVKVKTIKEDYYEDWIDHIYQNSKGDKIIVRVIVYKRFRDVFADPYAFSITLI